MITFAPSRQPCVEGETGAASLPLLAVYILIPVLIPPSGSCMKSIDSLADEIGILGGGSSAALKPAMTQMKVVSPSM